MKNQQEYTEDDFVHVLNNTIDNHNIQKRNIQYGSDSDSDSISEIEKNINYYQTRLNQENLDSACLGSFFLISCISIILYLIV